MSKGIWTEETVGGEEIDIILAWGISETFARIFCSALGSALQKDVEKTRMKSQKRISEWGKVWKVWQAMKGF